MPREPIGMRKIKEFLRLKFHHDPSDRQIAGAVRVGKATVSEYATRAKIIWYNLGTGPNLFR